MPDVHVKLHSWIVDKWATLQIIDTHIVIEHIYYNI